ncbi:HAD family hydrolase [Paractinoplanes brasiliensis]|uniref:Phosphoglycolate phosphatase-like HAD superfamily hydrolase n=1 Tax=Paractinoplanes brasiliensis TaxID=52695 RepID=A0A4R6JRV4_9ACTN|nr:HAD hydrolase-like protein [Actinoplanes brasiliensis]TDO39310.1 phosphoglycolate phosphatase-like HAD superfamily hydrolase [Actinoplanes brasiliensis]
MDFDGPICSVFAGYPAPRVATELVKLLVGLDIEVPAEVRGEPDPMEVLRWAGEQCSPKVVTAVEDALCEAELRAVAVASPTPFGHELIANAHARGLPVAIVSNNSVPAVEAYLAAHELTSLVAPIVGRAYADPARMKPHPGPIRDAVRILGASHAYCTLVGDSLTDIEAAQAAGVGVVGYANRSWKVDAFSAADAVVTSMQDLAEILLSNGT